MEPKEKAKSEIIEATIEELKVSEPGIRELIIRDGEAERIDYPNAIKISGTIFAPGIFINKRSEFYEKKNVHVTYSLEDLEITLNCDETSKTGATIKGSLEISPELEEFKINKNHTFAREDLKQFLKMNRAAFPSQDENIKIVASLTKFNARVEVHLQDENNNQGSRKTSYTQEVKFDIPLSFRLKLPLFKGTDPVAFNVDILYNVTGGDVKLWFESPELKELQTTTRDKIIDKELKLFEDYVVIQL